MMWASSPRVSVNRISPPTDEGADCLWQSLSVSLEATTETAVERWQSFALKEGEKVLKDAIPTNYNHYYTAGCIIFVSKS